MKNVIYFPAATRQPSSSFNSRFWVYYERS